jgi:hypothetical protein
MEWAVSAGGLACRVGAWAGMRGGGQGGREMWKTGRQVGAECMAWEYVMLTESRRDQGVGVAVASVHWSLDGAAEPFERGRLFPKRKHVRCGGVEEGGGQAGGGGVGGDGGAIEGGGGESGGGDSNPTLVQDWGRGRGGYCFRHRGETVGRWHRGAALPACARVCRRKRCVGSASPG